MAELYIIFGLMAFVFLFIMYFIKILIDALWLSIVGYLLSRIFNIKLKYKSVYNLSIYSLTLSTILYMIYIVANMYTGFTIKHFDIPYNAIAYIYIITAVLMIRSDLIKQQMEVGKIVEEQKKIREDNEGKEENKEEPKEDNKDKEDNKNKKKEEPEGKTPEGNEA